MVAMSCTLWSTAEHASPGERPSEYDVEAAYLFNFAKFIRWPSSPDRSTSSFAICVIGDDPFGTTLDKIVSGEKIAAKTVVDKRITHLDEISGCSILYISSSEANHLGRILIAAKDLPVLTVSDIPDFIERGGMIQFVLQDNRVRFAVNLEPAQHDGLTLSSDLLKVATNVKRAEGSH